MHKLLKYQRKLQGGVTSYVSYVPAVDWIVYVYVNEDAPVISCPRQEHWVSVGDRAVVSCSVSANPGSLLTWMRSVGKIMEHITDPTINVSIKVRSSSQW